MTAQVTVKSQTRMSDVMAFEIVAGVDPSCCPSRVSQISNDLSKCSMMKQNGCISSDLYAYGFLSEKNLLEAPLLPHSCCCCWQWHSSTKTAASNKHKVQSYHVSLQSYRVGTAANLGPRAMLTADCTQYHIACLFRQEQHPSS